MLTVEDWGVGMRAEDLTEANDLLKAPRDVDLSVSQRLGLHVVARLAQRHGIEVALTPTPGCGVTAAVVLPPSLFADPGAVPDEVYADEAEVPAEVVPAAVAASTVAPAADQPAPPNWPRAERWIDLTDDSGPESRSGSGSAGNGHGHGGDGYAGNGDQHPAEPGRRTDPAGYGDRAPGRQRRRQAGRRRGRLVGLVGAVPRRPATASPSPRSPPGHPCRSGSRRRPRPCRAHRHARPTGHAGPAGHAGAAPPPDAWAPGSGG